MLALIKLDQQQIYLNPDAIQFISRERHQYTTDGPGLRHGVDYSVWTVVMINGSKHVVLGGIPTNDFFTLDEVNYYRKNDVIEVVEWISDSSKGVSTSLGSLIRLRAIDKPIESLKKTADVLLMLG